MRYLLKSIFTLSFLLSFLTHSAQQGPPTAVKIKITGKVLEKATNQPLEYATVTFTNPKNPKGITGGITDPKGNFNIDIIPGTYNIKIEFISFRPIEINLKTIQKSTVLGTFSLEEDAAQLKEVVITSEKSSVEIKLDKKIYNVGQDLTVKGGTASDVLNNVPSVTVDTDGTVSMRGNSNVRILIDGRPSNATNINDALRSISSDALDKVEVITNPSARYDAEGGAGIINIVLKKGKNNGVNGSVVATLGNPKNLDISTNFNYKTNQFNFFSNFGYNDSRSPGITKTNTNYLNNDGSLEKVINEVNNRERKRNGFNTSFGIDLYLTPTITWTNGIKYRNQVGKNPEDVNLYNYQNSDFFVRNRYNSQSSTDKDFQYTSNFTKKFSKDGHKVTVDFSTASSKDKDITTIADQIVGTPSSLTKEYNNTAGKDITTIIQGDYVLPLGENTQFEAGYKGQFKVITTDYEIGSINSSNNYIPNPNYSNILEYKEKINAVYTQFGSKINKFSYLFGLRYEDSNININLLSSKNFNTKKYDNLFPSAFLTYQISNNNSISINYSKRISRPSSRYINPSSRYSSNVNIFQGNSDLNPSFTDVYELGYLTKIGKATLTSSIYYNKSTSVFQFIRRPNGDTVETVVDGQTVITPVIVTTPINLADENRYGFEFNLNYSPFNWWKLNNNLNIFNSKVTGKYSYTDINNVVVNQNFDRNTLGWYTRLTSKVNLPYKIDWQTNGMYFAPQKSIQGKYLSMMIINLAFSKDVLKEKATVSMNVSDLFNSGKRRFETYIPGEIESYTSLQFRVRQINVSFTYRFNKKKGEGEKAVRPQNETGEGDFAG
ncbi:TonB-dependent receptor domain-containing protein [Flavobacterium sp. 7A]|uniref:TonB-dependent receptor domain-containing protein n=1 Tax=Flavobacterium sp. 7A TaxID=2940571 RepID=UPI002226BB27|nr:TonB-dependent receptor [Flavobacterium sp. 7A]MCW2120127.1 outer membrane receptor protein involved in Fe transport [Flavobacterium sp. 7A]